MNLLLLSKERSNDVSMGNSCRAVPCFSIDSAFQVFGLSQRWEREQWVKVKVRGLDRKPSEPSI